MSPQALAFNSWKGRKENLKPETLQKLSEASKGVKNPAALKCVLKNPAGEIISGNPLSINVCANNALEVLELPSTNG